MDHGDHGEDEHVSVSQGGSRLEVIDDVDDTPNSLSAVLKVKSSSFE